MAISKQTKTLFLVFKNPAGVEFTLTVSSPKDAAAPKEAMGIIVAKSIFKAGISKAESAHYKVRVQDDVVLA